MAAESNTTSAFLTAEWRHLLMVNHEVDRQLLEHRVPKGTVLDTHRGKAYVSLVGFLFLGTRLKGVPIPFHQDFEEVNLRYYVRRFDGVEWRRGVVFLKEIVPKVAIAATARWFYHEPYTCLPMRHRVSNPGAQGTADLPTEVHYEWEHRGRWLGMQASAGGRASKPGPGSLDEFITEHYWGYTAQPDGSTHEYRVEHPPWEVRRAENVVVSGDFSGLYDPEWVEALAKPHTSAFIAEGSGVTVYEGTRLPS